MKESQAKHRIEKAMRGQWRARKHGALFELTMNAKEVCIEVNGVQADCFSAKGEWKGDAYCFIQAPAYFVTYVDDDRLDFGARYEPGSPLEGTVNWSVSLTRVRTESSAEGFWKVISVFVLHAFLKLKKWILRISSS